MYESGKPNFHGVERAASRIDLHAPRWVFLFSNPKSDLRFYFHEASDCLPVLATDIESTCIPG